MTYQKWLEEQGLTWSQYCKLDVEEKEVLREQFEEYKDELSAGGWG